MITSIFTKVITDYSRIKQSLSLNFEWNTFKRSLYGHNGFLLDASWYHSERGMRQNGSKMYDWYVPVNEARIKGSKVHLK